MEFTVSYEAGIYRFVVQSTEPDVDYREEFELTDRREVRATVLELVEAIAKADEEFEEDLWGMGEQDDGAQGFR